MDLEQLALPLQEATHGTVRGEKHGFSFFMSPLSCEGSAADTMLLCPFNECALGPYDFVRCI